MGNDMQPFELPEIPPDAPQVSMVMLECRTCGERGPWGVENPSGDNRHNESLGAAYEWHDKHAAARGEDTHSHFYRWSITRNTGLTRRL